MQVTTIHVTEVVPPQPGKKRGRVKDSSGALYQAGYPLLSSFQPGNSYNIVYKDDSFNNVSFRVIESIQGAAQGGQPQSTPYQPTTTMPQPRQQYNVPAPQTHTDPTAERIFVCGALNAALSNPNMHPATLTSNQVAGMVKVYREAWDRTFGGKPTVGDDMNDEIPFDGSQSEYR